jgi:hypothetical protein
MTETLTKTTKTLKRREPVDEWCSDEPTADNWRCTELEDGTILITAW